MSTILCFLDMTISVFGNSNSNDNKVDTTFFVRKSYLKSSYIENEIDSFINFKNQYRIINIPHAIKDKDIVNKIYEYMLIIKLLILSK